MITNSSSRQSTRKVKLTTKFEEFSTSRLASIQRHHDQQTNAASGGGSFIDGGSPSPNNTTNNTSATATPISQAKHVTAASVPVKIEREPSQRISAASAAAGPSASAAAENNQVTEQTPARPVRERAQKHLRKSFPAATVQSSTPSTPSPAFEPITPTYGNTTPMPKLTANGKVRGRPRKCWTQQKPDIPPAPRTVGSTREELLRLRRENEELKTQLEQKNTDYEELKRQSSYTGETVPKSDFEDLREKYELEMTDAKRRQWCYVCLAPSRYYCCWNTTYCSQKCQVHDWYTRHMKSCERRRKLMRTAE